ncbi:MAG: hypothetical protein U0W24_00265 [Bacteroidales bacterium]
MDELINNELIKIQDELSALDGAVKQIEKAEMVATSVIKTITELQGKYANHLDFIQKQVSTLFSNTDMQVQGLTKELSEKYTMQLQEVSSIFEDYHKKTVLTQNQNNDLIKRTLDKTDSQIYQISASHNKQIEEVHTLLSNYLDLAQTTAKLNEEVQKINFPKRLGNLESAAMQLNQVQVQLKNDFLVMETSASEIKKYNKKINTKTTITLILVVLIFLVVGAIGGELLFRVFPELMNYVK